MQKVQDNLKLSEKNREIEKKRYKKKIDALRTEIHQIKMKPETIDLLSNSSDDDQDEAEDLDDDQNEVDDEEDDNLHFQEQSTTSVPLASGHSMPNGDNGPCKHSSDGQHPDFEFSDDSDFDMNEWEEDPNSVPKVVLRRRTVASKKNHSKGKKNKKN